MYPKMKRIRVGGLPVNVVDCHGLAERLAVDADARSSNSLPKLVFSSNGQGISMNAWDKELSGYYEEADIIHADGMSVVFASRMLLNTKLPERVGTTDFFHNAVKVAMKKQLSFFLLGATAQENLAARKQIEMQYPELRIVGSRDGYFSLEEEADVCRHIRDCGTDVLWVALGRKRQEGFCVRNRQNLKGLVWLKTCGGLFNFLSGKNRRAPVFVQRLGLEWGHRLLLDPRRLFWRYFVTNLHSSVLILLDSSDIDVSVDV